MTPDSFAANPRDPRRPTDTQLIDMLEKHGTGVYELDDGGWWCDLQSGPSALGDTARAAMLAVYKQARRKRLL